MVREIISELFGIKLYRFSPLDLAFQESCYPAAITGSLFALQKHQNTGNVKEQSVLDISEEII